MNGHTTTRLENGVQLIEVPVPGVQSVTALVLSNTGSRFETPEMYGVAHFFEHMVFKGTRSYPDAAILSSTIDGIGADFNAFTSKEYTGYFIKSASAKLETAVSVLADMMLQPLLKDEDIQREKGVIIEEINMYEDTPMRLVSEVFERALYAGTGLGHDVLGTKETITGMTRDHFISFLNQWYGLSNLTVILAGDARIVGTSQSQALIEQYFSAGESGRASAAPSLDALLDRQPLKTGHVELYTKQTEQAHLILAWPGVERSSEDRYAISVLSTLIGGTMSSRLFSEVREKRGLCYYVRSDVDTYHDVGSFGAAAGVDPSRLDEALEVIRGEYQAMVSGERPITPEELERAVENIIGTTTLSLEDSQSVAQYYGLKHMLLGEIESPESLFEKIRAVTLDDVNLVLERLITDQQPSLALVGPFEDRARFEQFVA